VSRGEGYWGKGDADMSGREGIADGSRGRVGVVARVVRGRGCWWEWGLLVGVGEGAGTCRRR